MTLKTKTILRYALVLTFGLLLGWLIFATGEEEHVHDLQPVETAEGTIWTCSMHPQIRQNEPGDCPICGMDLIPLEEEAGESNPYQLTMTSEAVRLANVQTSTIGVVGGAAEDAGKELTLSGKIQLNENRVLSQTAHFPGRIEKLFINYEGEKVAAGQTIALLYSPQLLTAQQELLEAMKFADNNPSLLASAQRKLKLWKLSDQQIQQVMDSGEPITNWPIKADYSGVVTSINIESGEHVAEGAVLYEVADLNQLWAVFDAYEQNLPWIKEGDNIRFRVSAYPEREFSGKVSFIDPFINPQTRVAEVRTEVNNAESLLKPRMFARARLSSADPKGFGNEEGRQLTLPKSAVMWTGKRSVVYVKVPGTNVPTYEMREVTLGSSLGDAYLVEEGLQAGEEVVTNGTFTVDAAAQLNNKASMMNRDIKVKQNLEVEENPEQLQLNVPDFVSATPEAFQLQLQSVVNQYLILKDELVASRQDEAQESAESLLSSLETVDMSLLPDEPHMYWMARLKEIEEHAEAIASTENIDEQRKFFKTLSEGLIRSAKAFGTAEKLYVQYCPMANDDQGANWLSQSEEIRNPYYGNMMLTCGNVEEIINP
jgi:Cu(I)/Ag(I) efflux system membrane fusion protein